ncbi:sugar isomerase [Rhodoglobus sp. NPDC076762]
MSAHVWSEINSQPSSWRTAAEELEGASGRLPRDGERIAVVGCGTSWFIAMAYASLRETAGLGETDAFAGSEVPAGREYDRVVAISRSGTTTEIIDLLRAASTPTTLITAVDGSPAAEFATDTIVLGFADEESVVQTRYATTVLALLRGSLGANLEDLAVDAQKALEAPLDAYLDADQITFLGRGWTIGLAHEAALKCREAAQLWTESYPAMDYRHGPISIAQPGRLVWAFGEVPAGLANDVASTGATFVHLSDIDPLAQLIVAQRVAAAISERKGFNPDKPRNLTRSVILDDE